MPATSRISARPPAVGVLLAAGAGTRLGRGPKALLAHRGRPLVEHVADALLVGGCESVVVVLGAEAQRVRAECALDGPGVDVVVNEDWARGMASSLRAGVAVALRAGRGPDVPGPAPILVAHVDQPGVTPDDVARLLAAHRPGRVAASRWADAPGGTSSPRRWSHPLVLDGGHAADAVATASGDRGARDWLSAHADLIDVVTHPGDGRDVDTEADLDLLA